VGLNFPVHISNQAKSLQSKNQLRDKPMKRLTVFFLLLFLAACFTESFGQNNNALPTELSQLEGKDKIDYLNSQAELLIQTNPEKLIDFSLSALQLSENISYSIGMANALLNLGDGYFVLEDYYKSIDNYKSSLEVFKKIQNNNKIALLNFNIGTAYKSINDLNSAKLYFKQSYNYYQKDKDNKGSAKSLRSLAGVQLTLGEYEESKNNYLEALGIVSSFSDNVELALCYNDLGYLFFAWGNNAKSIEYYEKALALSNANKNNKEIVNVSNNIGIVFLEIRKLDVANNYFQKALNISNNIEYELGKANSLLNLGEIKRINRNFNDALKNIQSSLELFENIRNNDGISRSLLALAQLYKDSGKNYKALQICKRALSLNELLKNKRAESLTLYHIAVIYLNTNNIDYGIEFFNKSIKIAKDFNYHDILQNNYLEISKSYEKLGNLQEALKYQVLYSSLKDSILTLKSMSRIAESQSNIEVMKSKKEIEELEQDNLVQQLELEAQNKQRNFLFFITIIIFLLASIIYYRYHLKTRLNKEVVEQKNKVELLNKELNRKNAYLVESESKLKYLNATKDKFFSIISHDLKNPFSTLMGYTDLLIEFYNDFSEDEKKSIIQEIQGSTYKTYNLLENLLQWSKSQRGELKMTPEKLDLSIIVSENITHLSETAKKKNLNFNSEIKPGTFALADYSTLSTVIKNLLTNSIKFTSSGGDVLISAIEKDNNIEITVSDNGVAISEDDIGKLFRIDVHHTSIGVSAEKSTGLGLILCKEFVEKNGGKIWVESEMGKGSEFKFTLPKYND
jgi:two-component system sensor histidine kinase/response regulator